jgi:NAD(P)H-hydrate epimerase
MVARVDGADTSSTWVNPTGNAGMATGGSGDVLTGTIAGLLAQTKDALNATLLGVYLHGLAGDLAFEKHGNGLVAGDIAAHLGAALRELEHARGEEINGRLRRMA